MQSLVNVSNPRGMSAVLGYRTLIIFNTDKLIFFFYW